MKAIHKILYPLLAAAMLSGCDSIAPDDRFIPTEDTSVNTTRCVLLEEFTGQLCVNCPEGHKIIAQLREQYGDRFIPVSIHAGVDRNNTFGVGQFDGITGLAVAEGEALATRFGIDAYPAGIVDRATGPLTMDAWAAAVSAQFAEPSTVEITPVATLSGRTLTVETRLKAVSAADARLQIYLVESGIVAPQLTPEYKDDYVHNHVFRGWLCGADGEPVSLDPTLSEVKLTHTLQLPDYCGDADHLSVVAFVCAQSGPVLQAAETKVTLQQ